MSRLFEDPSGKTEQFIAEMWSELLGVEQIGRQDDFFELGGHSVLAMGMLARLRDSLQADLTLTELFRRSRLADFAESVETARQQARPSGTGAQDRTRVTLSPAQERIWFMEQMYPDEATYHLHWALRLKGRLVPAALEQAVREVQRRHDILRVRINALDDGPVQIVESFAGGTVEHFDFSHLEPAEREMRLRELALKHARVPFDLAKGPPLRVYIVKMASDDWALMLNLHHLAGDGWSLQRFFSDVEAYYAAFISGEAPALQPLKMQYVDYVSDQRAYVESERFRDELAYWTQQLQPPLQPLQLATDFPRPVTPNYSGAIATRMMRPALLGALRTLARSEGTTVFTVLLAAFNVLLHRRTANTDIVLGTDVANRAHANAESLIGLFVNQLVVRTSLDGQPSFRGVLRRVRQTVLDALAHQQVAFDRVVRELKCGGNASSNPLFQIMFLMHSATPADVRLPGLEVEPIDVPVETSPFDLTVSFAEMPSGELRMDCRYRLDLFRSGTIEALMEQMESLLVSLPLDPDGPIGSRDATANEPGLTRLLSTRPRPVTQAPESFLLIDSTRQLPLMIRPGTAGIVLDEFARQNSAWIQERLLQHGSILFRDFGVDSAKRLDAFTSAIAPGALDYGERSSPRSRIEGNVFTSTDHPAAQPIVLHHEQSYTRNWPMKILFGCIRPAERGGATPLADSRRVLDRLDARTVAEFERRGVLYVRNYGNGAGLSWHEAFQTQNADQVERHCREADIDFEWLSGGRLRTYQKRPAIRKHPVTGERVWFNHAYFFNVESLGAAERDALLAAFGREDLPYHTCFGDGGEFAPEMLEEIRSALDAETVSFGWQKGDLLLVDNMLVAHGREPYEGPRQIMVTMAEPSAAFGF